MKVTVGTLSEAISVARRNKGTYTSAEVLAWATTMTPRSFGGSTSGSIKVQSDQGGGEVEYETEVEYEAEVEYEKIGHDKGDALSAELDAKGEAIGEAASDLSDEAKADLAEAGVEVSAAMDEVEVAVDAAAKAVDDAKDAIKAAVSAGEYRAGKFEIYKDKRGEFRFRLKASNGQNILASEGYNAKSGCTNGIESVQKNAADDKRYERKDTKSGKYMFNLKASDNQVIGTSESYNSVAARDNGIESVKKNAPGAKVVDLSDA
jgi:uncharacterized protein YegP (UPF0339 family)